MERTYKLVELVGISEKGYDDAVKNAIKAAGKTLKGMSWFEVQEMRGHLKDDNVTEFQVKLKAAFRVLDNM